MSGALAKIHIAKKELDMEDADYRALLKRVTGQESAKGLSWQKMDAVLVEMKRLGWVAKPKLEVVQGSKAPPPAKAPVSPRKQGDIRKNQAAAHPTARKARALWISLWQLGVIEDNSEKALEAFAKRQLKCDRLVWADQQQMYKLIEALKAMAERNGWSQKLAINEGVYDLHRRLVMRQFQLLEAKFGNSVGDLVAPRLLDDIDSCFGNCLNVREMARLSNDLGSIIQSEGANR